MKLEFTIVNSADATSAADILDYIASVLAGENTAVKPTRTRRARTAPAPVAAEAEHQDTIDTIKAGVAEAVAVGETLTVEAETAVEAEPAQLDIPAEPTPEPVATKTRAELQDETRGMCLKLGVVWLRENVTMKYGKGKLSEVTDAQLLEIHTAALAAVAAAV